MDTHNAALILEELLDLGVELANLKDLDDFLRRIVRLAKIISSAEGITIYMKSEDEKALDFYVVYNEQLGIFLSGEEARVWPSISLYDEKGRENLNMVAAVCALRGEIINIEDVYETSQFDFSGTKLFDRLNRYRSKSMVVIPMRNHDREVIGVLQLINKKKNGEVVSFTKRDERYVGALAAQAATAITKTKLIQEFEELLESFLQTIALALDEKSKFTSDHIKRVAYLMEQFVEKVNETGFANKHYTQDEKRKLMWAAWMHDIGKIVTPEYILNKATKLECVCDRIEKVRLKFALYQAQLQISLLRGEISKDRFEEHLEEARKAFEVVEKVNKSIGKFDETDRRIIEKFHNIKVNIADIRESIINDEEFENLLIENGTLNKKERKIINYHAVVSKKMLSSIKFPKKYKEVAHIAASHHERLDGSGYPDGLRGEDLSFEDRVLGVLDIFEALSAPDRPYKKPLRIVEIKQIIYSMVEKGKLDKTIVDFLFSSGIVEDYFNKYSPSSK